MSVLDQPEGNEILEIDIATRMISDDEDIFIVRPGAKFSLYDIFDREGVVFLDFPALDLSFKKKLNKKNATSLREQIVRSIAIRDWHLRGRPSPSPARDLKSYKGKTANRRLGRYIGDISRLYYEFQPGTIILVPGPGYISDVIIGVITGEPEYSSNLNLYPDEKIPIRRVKWIGRKLKATFSPGLRRSLSRPDPIMRIDPDFREEVLRAAFDQYSFSGSFAVRLETTKFEFNTLDDFNLQSFTNFIAGAALAAERVPNAADDSIDLHYALQLLKANPTDIPELASNINSPGFLRLSSSSIAPLTIAVILTLALSTPAGSQIPEFRIRNSAGLEKDPCAVQVQEQALNVMRISSSIEVLKVCAQLRDAAEKTGLKTAMKVTRVSSKKRD